MKTLWKITVKILYFSFYNALIKLNYLKSLGEYVEIIKQNNHDFDYTILSMFDSLFFEDGMFILFQIKMNILKVIIQINNIFLDSCYAMFKVRRIIIIIIHFNNICIL